MNIKWRWNKNERLVNNTRRNISYNIHLNLTMRTTNMHYLTWNIPCHMARINRYHMVELRNPILDYNNCITRIITQIKKRRGNRMNTIIIYAYEDPNLGIIPEILTRQQKTEENNDKSWKTKRILTRKRNLL